MSNATLAITATVTNGGTTKDIELEQCHRVINMAVAQARGTGKSTTSGTATEGNASATWTYTPVAGV
jgi:hypothetical protein